MVIPLTLDPSNGNCELIIYTSADPVLQIAAHEDVIPLDELYRICEYARSITLERPALLGRIIAALMLGT